MQKGYTKKGFVTRYRHKKYAVFVIIKTVTAHWTIAPNRAYIKINNMSGQHENIYGNFVSAAKFAAGGLRDWSQHCYSAERRGRLFRAYVGLERLSHALYLAVNRQSSPSHLLPSTSSCARYPRSFPLQLPRLRLILMQLYKIQIANYKIQGNSRDK